jgi:hypothetical protein
MAMAVKFRRATNPTVFAVGKPQLKPKGFFVRVVVLGYTYARQECRAGEEIREAKILIAPRPIPQRGG